VRFLLAVEKSMKVLRSLVAFFIQGYIGWSLHNSLSTDYACENIAAVGKQKMSSEVILGGWPS
jgi:hypothetical protein